MSTAPATIPYEKQGDSQTSRMCGAACLSMVYRSLGKVTPQAEIWPVIAKQNQFGSLASTTHLMVQDALNRGLPAVAIQARHPFQALRLCHEAGIRAILNHRLQPDVGTGHYTVMVDLDSTSVVVHDPYFGPSRRFTYAELATLWQPHPANSEISGNVLIAIASAPPPPTACQFCRALIPPSVECPRCKKAVGLQPSAVLGCLNTSCIARMWNYVCCPFCDFMLESIVQPEQAAAAPVLNAPAADSAAEPASLNQMFEALDKFVDHVKRMPGLAHNTELQEQFKILAGSKALLTTTLAEAAVHGKSHADRLAAFVQASKERGEAHRKKMEQLNTPVPPLDGTALGRALLKNLGFIR